MYSSLQNDVIVITGAAGFLGRHCGKELHNQGYKVIGIDEVPFPDFDKWGFIECMESSISIDCFESLAGKYSIPSAIVHCAGSGSVAYSFENPEGDFSANVLTTFTVLEFARRFSDKIHIVLPSSAAVYGAAQPDPQIETGAIDPISPYGVHKRISEELCISYSKNFNVSTSVVRLFSIYGAGLKKQLLWDACVKAENGSFVFSGHGDEIRDFLHVSDASKLLIMAIDKASKLCPIVNGGSGNGVTIKELLTMLGSNWNVELIPIFSGDKRAGDPAHYIADVSILKSWDYKPLKNLKESIKEYVEWFQMVKVND